MLVKSEISTTLDGLSLKITPHCWLFTSNLNFQPHPWIYIYIHTFVHHIYIYIYIICSCATTWTTTVPSPRWYSYCYDTRLTKLKSGFIISPLLAGSLLSVSPCHVCCLFIRTCTGYVCLMDSCLFFLDNPFCRFYRHFCCCRTPVSTGEVRTLAGSSGLYRK